MARSPTKHRRRREMDRLAHVPRIGESVSKMINIRRIELLSKIMSVRYRLAHNILAFGIAVGRRQTGYIYLQRGREFIEHSVADTRLARLKVHVVVEHQYVGARPFGPRPARNNL